MEGEDCHMVSGPTYVHVPRDYSTGVYFQNTLTNKQTNKHKDRKYLSVLTTRFVHTYETIESHVFI